MTYYLKVRWLHDFVDEPVLLYSEVGDNDYEIRKVHVFPDGHLEWADVLHETAMTSLGTAPMGNIEDVAAQAEFVPTIITGDEFEASWNQARGR
jgi:hypothetical protein